MALSKLSGDEAGIVFIQLCNVLEPRLAVNFSSASNELREPMQALLQQLRAEHEVAVALCLKVGLRSCKELREVKRICWIDKRLTAADLTTLGKQLLGAASAREAGHFRGNRRSRPRRRAAAV